MGKKKRRSKPRPPQPAPTGRSDFGWVKTLLEVLAAILTIAAAIKELNE